MIDSRDRQARPADASLPRAGLWHFALLCVAACAASGCVHRGVVVQGDWSIGVNHVPWDECSGCATCGSVGGCRHGRSVGYRGGGYASESNVREYESVPTVPRFHPVPTSRVLTDPSKSSPTVAEPLPLPPRDYNTDSDGSMDAPTDAPPPLPQDLGTGRYRAGPGHQQMAQYRRPNQTPSRWAFRTAPPYYPRRR